MTDSNVATPPNTILWMYYIETTTRIIPLKNNSVWRYAHPKYGFTGTAYVKSDDTTRHYVDGKLHSTNDEPAVIFKDGVSCWFKEDLQHRDGDLPAMVFPNGTKFYYKNGVLHRDNDEPACEWASGIKWWYNKGSLIKTNNPKAVSSWFNEKSDK